jgi:hypothetical protein
MGTKQKAFTAAVERACPGLIAELERIAAEARKMHKARNV